MMAQMGHQRDCPGTEPRFWARVGIQAKLQVLMDELWPFPFAFVRLKLFEGHQLNEVLFHAPLGGVQ